MPTDRAPAAWRRRVAYAASPWSWPKPAFELLGLAIACLTVASVVVPLVRSGPWLGRVIAAPLSCAIFLLVFVRGYVRSIHRRDVSEGS